MLVNVFSVCCCPGLLVLPLRRSDPGQQSGLALCQGHRNDLREAQKLKIQVHRLTPAQRAEWVRATSGTQRELVAAVGGDSERIFNGILAAKRAFAARAPAPQVPAAAPAKPASPTPAR